MFNRLFNRSNNNLNNDNGSHDGSTPENSSQGEEPNEEMPEPEESPIPSSPLVRTADCKTVVRLYLEVLSCDDLGPDFDENGERVTKTYTPYVKVKLGGNDDKDSLDIHKTKSVQQRVNTRDPIFDRVDHQSFFCIDGLYLDDLSKGLLFKVKDAAASVTQKKQKQDILGWALVQPDSLLWKAGMDDSASREYQGEVDYTLELELVHPVELVTGLAGNIHLICRPAREQEVEECRKKGWGYFKAYEHEEDTHIMERVELASTPPLRDDQAVEVNAAHELL